MGSSQKFIRGLQDIQTISNRTNMTGDLYRTYLKIGALEMERARRMKERQSAIRRVKLINERFEQIEKEKIALLKLIQDKDNIGVLKSMAGAAHGASASCRNGFKLKYG